jgi:hypothetical protein
MDFLLMIRVSKEGEIERVGVRRSKPTDVLNANVLFNPLFLSPQEKSAILALIAKANK